MVTITKRNGNKVDYQESKIVEKLALAGATANQIEALMRVFSPYDGITTAQINEAIQQICIGFIKKDNFRTPEAKAWDDLAKGILVSDVTHSIFAKKGQKTDKQFLKKEFHWARNLKYSGALFIANKYLQGRSFEEFFTMFEDAGWHTKLVSAQEVSLAMSNLKIMPSTSTLQNQHKTGSKRQLASCSILTIYDDTESITKSVEEVAKMSRHGFGISIYAGRLREIGASVGGVINAGRGVVPTLKIFEATILTFDQYGAREGAGACWLPVWHPDIITFLHAKDIGGNIQQRLYGLKLGVCVPDNFMRAYEKDEEYYLISPTYTYNGKHLDDLMPEDFEIAYNHAVETKQYINKVPAKEIFALMSTLFKRDQLYHVFRDEASKQAGHPVNASNLCCVHGDDRVVTDKGLLTVRELYDLQCQNKVAGRHGIEEASAMLLPRPEARMVQINTKEGYFHRVTPDHKVMVDGQGWKMARYLEKGDKIVLQHHALFGENVDTELGFMLGYSQFRGAFSGSNRHISLSNDVIERKERLEEIVSSIITNHLPDTIYKLDGSKMTKSFDANPKFASDNKLCSSAFKRVMKEHGVGVKARLEVPRYIWKGNKSVILNYINGIMSAKGRVLYNTVLNNAEEWDLDNGYSILNCKQVPFLQELQILLLSIGVKSRIYKAGGEISQLVWLYNPLIDTGEYSLVKVDLSTRYHIDSHDLTCTFTHLDELERSDAYCLTVYSEDHSWTVNGMITKNTEIIGRSDDKNTVICNIGSVNVADVRLSKYESKENCIKEVEYRAYLMTAVLEYVLLNSQNPTERGRAFNEAYQMIGCGIMGKAQSDLSGRELIDALNRGINLYIKQRREETRGTGYIFNPVSTVAIAPNESISLICGCTPNCEYPVDYYYIKRVGGIQTPVYYADYHGKTAYQVSPKEQLDEAIDMVHGISQSRSLNIYVSADNHYNEINRLQGLNYQLYNKKTSTEEERLVKEKEIQENGKVIADLEKSADDYIIKQVEQIIGYAWKKKLKTLYYLFQKERSKEVTVCENCAS